MTFQHFFYWITNQKNEAVNAGELELGCKVKWKISKELGKRECKGLVRAVHTSVKPTK